MKFVTFRHENEVKAGWLLDDRHIIKTQQNSLLELIKQGKSTLDKNQDYNPQDVINRTDIELLAPIPRPEKNIFCIGKNYADHAKELGSEKDIPTAPMVFTKTPTTVIGPDENILFPESVTDSLDYEGELAVVIGQTGKQIQKEKAYDYVFGYTIINDVTARDLQKRHKQFFLGKSLDTSCPMGPVIVHKSAVKDPHHLKIETRVNGEVRQSANTSDVIFDIPELIKTISAGTTLEPGDIIATGTPAGVGKGFNPPRYLKAGDVVEITVEGIGTLKNQIINE